MSMIVTTIDPERQTVREVEMVGQERGCVARGGGAVWCAGRRHRSGARAIAGCCWQGVI